MYPCFQGYMRFVSLLFPLIRPRKVIHSYIDSNIMHENEAIITENIYGEILGY